MNWEGAKCVGMDPHLFDLETPEQMWSAKVICSQCPVIGRCLVDAMENGAYGVRAGLAFDGKKPMRIKQPQRPRYRYRPINEGEVNKQIERWLLRKTTLMGHVRKPGRSCQESDHPCDDPICKLLAQAWHRQRHVRRKAEKMTAKEA